MTNIHEIAKRLAGEVVSGGISCPGPGHSPRDRSLRVFLDPQSTEGFRVHSLAGDHWRTCLDYVYARLGIEPRRRHRSTPYPVAKTTIVAPAQGPARSDNTFKARALWRNRKPVQGTVVDNYLRKVRAYGGALPTTLGFLPARGPYEPAMIAAFGLAGESEPSRLWLPDSGVMGVHITRLLADGSGKADLPNAKIMLGRCAAGFPIVLAPVNDGLGLAITEGIEDGLSIAEATGLGVWAAGCAGRMPALADHIPRYVECLTIIGHDDPAGRKFAAELAERARERGINVSLKFLRVASDFSA